MNNKIIIIGGGHLGLMLGITLARAGLSVVVLERALYRDLTKEFNPSRLFAISEGSVKLIQQHVGIDITPLGQSINHIRVYEYLSKSAFIDFNPKDLKIDNFGIMIEESQLQVALQGIANSTPGLKLIENCKVKNIVNEQDFAQVILGDDTIYNADIALACDGKNSMIRSLLGIETYYKDYQQLGIVCDIKHEVPHGGIAIENFTPQGPFAILPKIGGYESSIVWTLNSELAKCVMELSPTQQLKLIEERFGNFLGKLEMKSKLKAYPFSLSYGRNYSNGRFYNLGDALHSIHPLAGQGLNLSIRDFDFIVTAIVESFHQGLDIGMNVNLTKYFKSRFIDNQLLIESTNLLNALFSNNSNILLSVRTLGLKIVNKLPWLKRYIMLYASGLIRF